MKKVMTIEGMTCGHCKARVEKALSNLADVSAVEVDLKAKTATIELADTLSDAALIEAVDDAGYDVLSIIEA